MATQQTHRDGSPPNGDNQKTVETSRADKFMDKMHLASTMNRIRKRFQAMDVMITLTGAKTNKKLTSAHSNHSLYHKRTIQSYHSEKTEERRKHRGRSTHSKSDVEDASSSSSSKSSDELSMEESIKVIFPVVSVFGYTAQVTTVLLTSVAAWNCFIVPFHWAFHALYSRQTWALTRIFIQGLDLLYFLSVLASFRISYIEIDKDENFVVHEIFWHRLTSKMFYIDLVSSIPLPLGSAAHAWLKLLRCYRLFTVSITFQHLQFTSAFLIGRLVCSVLYFSHLVACVWFHIIDMQGKSDQYLAKGYDASGQAPWAYWMALRDGVYMVFSRPIPALNNPEIALNIALTPIGAMVPAIIFGNINWLFQRVKARSMKHYEELSFLKQALKQTHNVPMHLKRRIVNYRRYMQIHHEYATLDKVVSGLSPTLLMELKLYLLAELLPSAEFFRGVTPMLLKSMVLSLNLCVFASGDFVIQKNESAKEMYFVIRGLLEFLAELDQPPIGRVVKGQHFGELALSRRVVAASLKRTAWVVAREFSHLAKLSRDSFDDMLLEFPDERDFLLSKITTSHRHTRDLGAPPVINSTQLRRSIEEVLTAAYTSRHLEQSTDITPTSPKSPWNENRKKQQEDKAEEEEDSEADSESILTPTASAKGSTEGDSVSRSSKQSKDSPCPKLGGPGLQQAAIITPTLNNNEPAQVHQEAIPDATSHDNVPAQVYQEAIQFPNSNDNGPAKVQTWQELRKRETALAVQQVHIQASLAKLQRSFDSLAELPALAHQFLGIPSPRNISERPKRPSKEGLSEGLSKRQSVKLEWKSSKGQQNTSCSALSKLDRQSTKASLASALAASKANHERERDEVSAPNEEFVKSLFDAQSAARYAPRGPVRSSIDEGIESSKIESQANDSEIPSASPGASGVKSMPTQRKRASVS